MPVQDLREWIERIEELGELRRVDGADPATAAVVNPHVMNVVDLVSVFRQQTRACGRD